MTIKALHLKMVVLPVTTKALGFRDDCVLCCVCIVCSAVMCYQFFLTQYKHSIPNNMLHCDAYGAILNTTRYNLGHHALTLEQRSQEVRFGSLILQFFPDLHYLNII